MEPVWDPARYPRESALAKILSKRGIGYGEFLRENVKDPETFWRTFFEDAGIPWPRPFHQVLDLSQGKPWPRWFVGGQTNLAWWAVGRHATEHPKQPALIAESEAGLTESLSYADLDLLVRRFASGLKQYGFQPGDRVGIYMPLNVHSALALLAVAAVGGIVVPLFSGFGEEAVRIRLENSGARFLITQTTTRRRGRSIPLLSVARQSIDGLSTLERVFVFHPKDLRDKEISADELLESPPLPTYPWMDGETPFMLIYTSGTTGKPKGTVHTHAGFPIKASQDMFHLFDVQPEDRITWLTDLGWMMGPWLVLGGLTLRATVVLYEGAPDYPKPSQLFEVWHRHGVELAGLAPTFIRAIRGKVEDALPKDFSLRAIGSTGEPWTEDAWWWTYQHLGKKRAPILNYSGGTEISGGILGCVVVRPIAPMSFNTAVPGVEADIVDDTGQSVRGEVGYLVVRNVNPGMTRGFWKDPQRYLSTYWERFPGIWYHGDLALRTSDDTWFILGRADDTLKVAGKRLGPAEMENVVTQHPNVREAAVIGVPHPVKGEVPVVFAVPTPTPPSEDLAETLRKWVAQQMGKALQPTRVYLVSDLPKTRNAKVMRRVLRKVFLGEDPGDLSALVNPDVLEEIRTLGQTFSQS